MPNLYPVLGAGRRRRRRAGGPPPPETGLASSIDPLGAADRGEADLFRSQPADGRPRGDRQRAPSTRPRSPSSPTSELAGAVAPGASGCAPTPTPPTLHLIVNEGPEAGASLEHTHAQLYALGFVPAEVARERERATAYHERTMGSHLLGDVATEEVRRRERLVAVDDDALLICPWASRSPFELRVIPRRPEPRASRTTRAARR